MVGSTTEVELEKKPIPNNYLILNNYPNPFNPTTKINWRSSLAGRQSIKIYDILGNEIVTLVNEYLPAGNYEITFDGATYKLSSGIYICKYQLEKRIYLKKIVLMK